MRSLCNWPISLCKVYVIAMRQLPHSFMKLNVAYVCEYLSLMFINFQTVLLLASNHSRSYKFNNEFQIFCKISSASTFSLRGISGNIEV